MVVNPLYGDAAEVAGTFVVAAGSGNNESTSFLDIENSNVRSYIFPFDATIIAIGASTNTAETWAAEVRNGLVTVVGSISIVAARTGFAEITPVDVNAGDEIRFFCNGAGVNAPLITAFFIRRIP